MSTSPSTIRTDLAGALSIGAGLVHAAAAGTHSGATTLVWLFALSAVVQVGAGALLLISPSRRAVLVTLGVNAMAAGAWVASRTTGIPFIADLQDREVVGRQDLLCALLAAGAVICAGWALRPAAERAHRLVWLPAVALLPAVLGVAAPHAPTESHDHGHEEAGAADADGHAHADEAAADDGHAHDEPAGAAGALAADPLLTGADTGDATLAELEAAVDLVEATRAEVSATFTDTASAEAAGYVWIGDGRRVGRYQHYIHPGYVADGVDLDPTRVESLVFESTAAGPVLVSTMYVLGTGQTMDDVPEVAGDLTVWHDHQNLCWDESGTKLAGVSMNGSTCVPAGTLKPTPPMLHVWLVDNACGPFAGIEGHGGGSTECAPHEH